MTYLALCERDRRGPTPKYKISGLKTCGLYKAASSLLDVYTSIRDSRLPQPNTWYHVV